MKSFGFTRKKFLSLSEKGRTRHLIGWLSRSYQDLGTNRITGDQFNEFLGRYEMVLGWTGSKLRVPPALDTPWARMIFVSDEIQRHRTAQDQVVRDHDLLDRVITGDRTTPLPGRPPMDIVVALDGLRSLFNIGSIFRTCETAGVRSMILGNCPGKEHPGVMKTAMGAQEYMIQEKTQDLAGCLETKKQAGYRIIAVETLADSRPCHDYAWPKKAVIVMGNEEYGIAPHVLAAADDAVHIPMFGAKNSLNVANALAVALFQAVFFHMSSTDMPPG